MKRTGPWLIVLFAAAFFAPELFGGKVAATANMARWRPWFESASAEERAAPSHNPDCNTSYFPRRWLLHEAWRAREAPLWNPWSFAGTPLLADPQTGVFYAPNWLLAPLDPKMQLGWFLFLHVAWGGAGAALLMRRHGVRPEVAVLGGCAFAVNGFFVKHFGQPSFLATAAWIPWVLAATDGVVARPTRRSTAWLALAFAGMFLAGQPQIAMLGGYAAAIVALFSRARRAASARGVWIALAGAALVAILLVGAQLLPTMDLARRSARADLPWSTVASGAFHPVDLVRFAVEEFFGTPITGDEWAFLFPRADGFYLRTQLNSFFAGTPLFLLAILGMTGARTRRAAAPFTALFVLMGLFAFGTQVARWAYELLPGFGFARLDRAGALLLVAQVVPAGLAASDLAVHRPRFLRAAGVAVVLLAAAATIVVTQAGDTLPRLLDAGDVPRGVIDAGTFARTPGRVGAAAVFAALTGLAWWLAPSRVAALAGFGLALLQLTLFAAPYRGDRPPDRVFAPSPGIETLRAVLDADGASGGGRFLRFGRDLPVRPHPTSGVLPPSTNVPYRLRDVQGYNALADRRLGEMLQLATGEDLFSAGIWTGRRIVEPQRAASLEHPLLDALAVRAVVGVQLPAAAGWIETRCDGFRMAVNEEAQPRVRLVGRGRGVSAGQLRDAVASARLDPRNEVLWVGDGALAPAGPASLGGLVIEEDSWNRIRVRTRTDAEAILVVADSYDAGWRATLDGARTPTLAAWGVVRAVRVPAGGHVVEMTYRPIGLRAGVALSVLGCLALAILFAPFARARSSG